MRKEYDVVQVCATSDGMQNVSVSMLGAWRIRREAVELSDES